LLLFVFSSPCISKMRIHLDMRFFWGNRITLGLLDIKNSKIMLQPFFRKIRSKFQNVRFLTNIVHIFDHKSLRGSEGDLKLGIRHDMGIFFTSKSRKHIFQKAFTVFMASI
jgi:hypothetical protein